MTADLIIIFVLLGFIAWGFLQGALKEVFSLLAIVLAFVLSGPLAGHLLKLVKTSALDDFVLQSAGRFVSWLVLYFLIILIGRLIETLALRDSKFRWINRYWGAVAGLFKGVFIILILLWAADIARTFTSFDTPAGLKKSVVFSLAQKHNLLKRTKKVQGLEKLQSLQKMNRYISELKKVNDKELQDLQSSLNNLDAGSLRDLVREYAESGGGRDSAGSVNIKDLQKFLKNKNIESVKKLKQAVK
ncbi:MAG: CvpA family protein [bacterium]